MDASYASKERAAFSANDLMFCGQGMSSSLGFPASPVGRLTGEEVIGGLTASDPLTVLNFWQWAWSDILANTTRGVLAEFLVAAACGLAKDVRQPWNPYDLRTRSGVRVEVKSAARWQSWYQRAPSRIAFGIRPTREWSPETNRLADVPSRQADVYVLALLDAASKEELRPLDVTHWRFFVIAASLLDRAFANRRMATLAALIEAGAEECVIGDLAVRIEAAATIK